MNCNNNKTNDEETMFDMGDVYDSEANIFQPPMNGCKRANSFKMSLRVTSSKYSARVVKAGKGMAYPSSIASFQSDGESVNAAIEYGYQLETNCIDARKQLEDTRQCTKLILQRELKKGKQLKFKVSIILDITAPNPYSRAPFKVAPNMMGTITNEGQIDDAIDDMIKEINVGIEKYTNKGWVVDKINRHRIHILSYSRQ